MLDRIGAEPISEQRCSFRVWAPHARTVAVNLVDDRRVEVLHESGQGYHTGTLEHVPPGTRYLYRLSSELERPDPASRCQADGVHGPSRVVDLRYEWTDGAWRGLPLGSYVLYELHVGTCSRAGTFAGVIAELPRLRELGVTAIELMPVAQFPGTRNWGYDGVYPFAVQDSYGGARGLQELVNACHCAGLAVVLDVVYNHLGPEGNYLGDFGPYFTDAYRTPWGRAVNFDGPHSEGVRRYFLENALQWFEDFHIDALRLDAVHAIIDRSARPFLEELADSVHRRGEELGRHLYLIAESDLNDARIVRPNAVGGYGLDAMWCDDFHHAVHSLLTGERNGYYADFGAVEHLARAFRTGMSNPGGHSSYRQRRHGRAAPDLRSQQCVVFVQNHDQIGNRFLGERLAALVSFEQQKLAAGILCLAPFVPLLFMGEEYAETAPFLYFVSPTDRQLLEAIRKGRQEEFASFAAREPAPDPGAPETLRRSVLNTELRHSGLHAVLYRLHRQLLELRPRLRPTQPDECIPYEAQRVLLVRRDQSAWMAFCFSNRSEEIDAPVLPGRWRALVSSADATWQGPGSLLEAQIESTGALRLRLQPNSFVCYVRDEPRSGSQKSPSMQRSGADTPASRAEANATPIQVGAEGRQDRR